jgi:hypothetical protein
MVGVQTDRKTGSPSITVADNAASDLDHYPLEIFKNFLTNVVLHVLFSRSPSKAKVKSFTM